MGTEQRQGREERTEWKIGGEKDRVKGVAVLTTPAVPEVDLHQQIVIGHFP